MSAATDTPPITEERALLRAEWLRSLTTCDREALFEMSLRQVDERFDAWLRASGRDPGPSG